MTPKHGFEGFSQKVFVLELFKLFEDGWQITTQQDSKEEWFQCLTKIHEYSAFDEPLMCCIDLDLVCLSDHPRELILGEWNAVVKSGKQKSENGHPGRKRS